jgi:tripartite-type tricarboxylate transporter receptor subunit TctC
MAKTPVIFRSAAAFVFLLSVTSLTIGFAQFGSAKAQVNVSFAGKTIQMVIASDPAGGTDLTGRLVAQYLRKYLPGEPQIVIRNMGAGGGKIRAANYLAQDAPADGTVLMQSDSTTLQPEIARRNVSRYDPSTFRVVGSINRGGSIVLVRKDAFARLNDPQASPVIVGAISGTRAWQAMLVWGKEFLGWNLQWIPGYQGTASLNRALRQGEIDAFSTNNIFVINELLDDELIVLLTQEGQVTDDGYTPRGSYPNVALFPDLLREANPPQIPRQGYQSVIGPSHVDKWLSLPPDTPDDILAVYRDAYAQVVQDPEFLALAKQQLSQELFIISGERVEEMIREIHGAPDEAVDYATDLRVEFGLITR